MTFSDDDNSGKYDSDGQNGSSKSDVDDESIPLPERPNLWRGQSDEWRQLTQNERSLSQSIDQLEDEDLSAHLYDAHVLKRKASRGRRPAEYFKSRERLYKKAQWYPSRSWTAWPDNPEGVPLEDEGAGRRNLEEWSEDATIRPSRDSKPSANLEAELVALMTNSVTTKFRQRHTAEQNNQPGLDVTQAGRIVSSRKDEKDDGNRISRDQSDDSLEILADEDAIERKLQPAARRIISHLDNVLKGLHHSRAAYSDDFRSNQDYGSRSPPSDSDAPVDEISGDSDGSASEDRPASRNSSDDDMSSNEVESEDSSRSNSPRRRRATRDWSEVLGVAFFSGMDTSVVERARVRCKHLFGEHMDIVHLHDTESAPSDQVEGAVDRSIAMKRFKCSEAGCKVKGTAFKERWRLKEHLKRVHGIHNAGEVDGETSTETTLSRHQSSGFLDLIELQPEWLGKAARNKRRKGKERATNADQD